MQFYDTKHIKGDFMDKIYKDDYGHIVIIETNVSLVGYATIELNVTKPSATEVVWNPTVLSPTTGVVTYTILEDDIDEVGIYECYVRVEYLDGSNYTGQVDTFEVYERGE